MADSLKGGAVANINNAAATDIFTSPALTTSSIISAVFSNKTLAEIKINVDVVRGGIAYNWVSNAPIPVGGALDVIENKPVVLMAGDKIRAQCSAANAADCNYSYLEQN